MYLSLRFKMTKMRIFKILFLIFILCLTNACAYQSHSLRNNSYWDFGRVREGRLLKHTFMLRNNSNKPLVIKKLDTSCGCTTLKISKDKLLPKETVMIGVSFDTTGYNDKVQQYVYVHTDSPENPIIKFTINAEIIKK